MPAKTFCMRIPLLTALALVCLVLPAFAAKATFYAVGAAKADITPDYPIRLSGYGARTKESEGIDQHLYAKALAIGSNKEGPALLITVENVALPAYMRDEVAARLDRGEPLPTELSYLVQTWNFGSELALVFLPGEVVVDYSLRLKREFDARRLWVNAYANDVPCYIPSRRIWCEGGYEGGAAMIYFDRPVRLVEGTEDAIVGAVRELMPKDFAAAKAAE